VGYVDTRVGYIMCMYKCLSVVARVYVCEFLCVCISVRVPRKRFRRCTFYVYVSVCVWLF